MTISSDHVQQLEMLPDAAPGSLPEQSPTLEMDIRHVPCGSRSAWIQGFADPLIDYFVSDLQGEK